MVETTAFPGTTADAGTDAAKNHFAKAVEEALAGAKALGAEAQNRAGEYREKLYEKKDGLTGEAKVRSDEYKEKAFGFADDGKARASGALSSLSQLITDNAGTLDEKIGVKYGDYARNAAQSVQGVAAKLDEKSLDELGEDAREFVRTSPALALGLAAAAGYLLGRVFK
jgi:ElaB/YqjD/DUF883 family membrane-anchored ribosome-binding protein